MKRTMNLPPDWATRKINIALAGCGGTGSEMIDELYRMHNLLVALGGEGFHVVAFDPDTVSNSNIGRQRFWPVDVGFPKAEILIERINNFGGLNWEYELSPFEPEWLERGVDILVSCTDTASFRARVGEYGRLHANDFGCLWLDCGNDTFEGNVVLGHCGGMNTQYIPNVFDLYPSLSTMNDDNAPSCSTAEAVSRQDFGINRSVAREGANILWHLIRHGRLEHHCSFLNLREGRVSSIPIDPDQWALFGYTQPETRGNAIR